MCSVTEVLHVFPNPWSPFWKRELKLLSAVSVQRCYRILDLSVGVGLTDKLTSWRALESCSLSSRFLTNGSCQLARQVCSLQNTKGRRVSRTQIRGYSCVPTASWSRWRYLDKATCCIMGTCSACSRLYLSDGVADITSPAWLGLQLKAQILPPLDTLPPKVFTLFQLLIICLRLRGFFYLKV